MLSRSQGEIALFVSSPTNGPRAQTLMNAVCHKRPAAQNFFANNIHDELDWRHPARSTSGPSPRRPYPDAAEAPLEARSGLN